MHFYRFYFLSTINSLCAIQSSPFWLDDNRYRIIALIPAKLTNIRRVPRSFSSIFCSQRTLLPQSLRITTNRKSIALSQFERFNASTAIINAINEEDKCQIEAATASQRIEHLIFFRNYTRTHFCRSTKGTDDRCVCTRLPHQVNYRATSKTQCNKKEDFRRNPQHLECHKLFQRMQGRRDETNVRRH